MRLAIIDHATHSLYIEDVDAKLIEEQYHGEEEEYIKDTYSLTEGQWSWDYIVDTEYYPNDDQDPIAVEFKDLL